MKIEKKRLYLDDVRTPLGDDWIIARNYDEFVSTIKINGLENFDVIPCLFHKGGFRQFHIK